MNCLFIFCVLFGIVASQEDDQLTSSSPTTDDLVPTLLEHGSNDQLVNGTEMKQRIEVLLYKAASDMRTIKGSHHYEASSTMMKYNKLRLQNILEQIKTSRIMAENRTNCMNARINLFRKIDRFVFALQTRFENEIEELYNKTEQNIRNFEKKNVISMFEQNILESAMASDFITTRLYDIAIDDEREIQKIKLGYNKKINATITLFNKKENEILEDLKNACGEQKRQPMIPLNEYDSNRLKTKLTLKILGLLTRNRSINSTIAEMEEIHRSYIANHFSHSYTWSKDLNKLILCGQALDGYTEESVQDNVRTNEKLISYCYQRFLNATNAFDTKFEDYNKNPFKLMKKQNTQIKSSENFESVWYRFELETTSKYLAKQDKYSVDYIECMDKVIPVVTSCEPKKIVDLSSHV